jgi:hypothetical protein
LNIKSFALLSALAVAAAAFAIQEPVLLRLKAQPNTVDHYVSKTESNQKVSSSMMPAQDITSTSTLDQYIHFGDKTADGKQKITIEIKNAKTETSAPVPQPNIEDIKVEGVLDDRYQLSDVKVPEDADPQVAAVLKMASQSFNAYLFPENPVKVGDTWEIPMPQTQGMKGMDVKLLATYAGVKNVEGKDYHAVTINQEIPLDMDVSETAGEQGAAMGEMRMKGSMKMSSESLFEIETGKLFSMTSDSEMDVVMTIAAIGGEVTVVGKIKSTVKKAE